MFAETLLGSPSAFLKLEAPPRSSPLSRPIDKSSLRFAALRSAVSPGHDAGRSKSSVLQIGNAVAVGVRGELAHQAEVDGKPMLRLALIRPEVTFRNLPTGAELAISSTRR